MPIIMMRPQFTQRAAIVMLLLFVALATAGCVNQTGVGVGAGSPARWGAGSTGPPIFVGGPAF
jgi:hypothetical protein